MIYQICDVMMSISTWHKVHFWIYILNHNSQGYSLPTKSQSPLLNKKFQVITQKTSFLAAVIAPVQGST